MSSLLARFAENAFWMARYVERVENLARILDVNETFARDAHGVQEWRPILRLHSDEEVFFEHYKVADAKSVVRFYTIDRRNPNCIVNAIHGARENARSLRHLISLETWTQINTFWNWAADLRAHDLSLNNLSRLCSQIKEGCELHTGIARNTMYRDQVWLFYQLGELIERCDQTTRLVDIKYHALTPLTESAGSPVDVGQWNALLRSVAGYHGYRRIFPRQMTPATVSRFILFDPHFPRSMTFCVGDIRELIHDLLNQEELAQAKFPMFAVNALEKMRYPKHSDIEPAKMHAFLDDVQVKLMDLTKDIDTVFFQSETRAA
ncbi:MAG: alpha-E domain-containing protein [Alphaproteobacteria bacterium]